MRLTTVIAAEGGEALLPVLTAALSGALDVTLLLSALLPLLTSQGGTGNPDVPVDGTEVSAVAACCAAVAKGGASITSNMGSDTSKSVLPCSFAVTSAPVPSAVSSNCTSAVALLSSAAINKITPVVASFSLADSTVGIAVVSAGPLSTDLEPQPQKGTTPGRSA